MKKVVSILLIFILMLSFSGCRSTLKDKDDLIEKAREVIPISDAESIDIQYVGQCTKEDLALIWFVSGNEYQAHYYLPVECTISENGYIFERTYKPMEKGMDIVALQWQEGYVFLVNNPLCTTIRITDSDGTRNISIEKDSYPYIVFNEHIPSKYLFLDADGREIK